MAHPGPVSMIDIFDCIAAYEPRTEFIVMIGDCGIAYSSDWRSFHMYTGGSVNGGMHLPLVWLLLRAKPGTQFASDVHELVKAVNGPILHLCRRRDWVKTGIGCHCLSFNDPEVATVIKRVGDTANLFLENDEKLEDMFENPRQCPSPPPE